jgi:hypothetical protein
MLLQPTLGRFVVWAEAFDFAPEPDGVIHLTQMTKLVKKDVILDAGWRLDEPPIQRNRPAPRARSPTRPLVPHRNPARGQLVQRRVFKNPWRQFLRSQAPQVSFNRWTQISRGVGQSDNLAAEPDHAALRVYPCLKLHRFAAKKYLRSNRPFFWPAWTRSQALQLPFEPCLVPLREPSSLGSRPALWNGHPCRTVRAEPEHITVRTRVADQHHGNLASIERQKLLC